MQAGCEQFERLERANNSVVPTRFSVRDTLIEPRFDLAYDLSTGSGLDVGHPAHQFVQFPVERAIDGALPCFLP